MFNLTKHTKDAQKCYERYMRAENTGPKANDDAPIAEKQLPHRDGFEQTVTEDLIDKDHKWANSENVQIYEKELNADKGKYIDHRNDIDHLSVPPMNAFVEKIHAKRVASEYKVEKKPNWTLSFDDKKQNASLPKVPKTAPQHDKTTIGDPSRFTGSDDPTKSSNDKITLLVGNITKADIDNVANKIKTGTSADRDVTILAILRLAEDERRELTDIERKTIVDLKIARTNALLEK